MVHPGSQPKVGFSAPQSCQAPRIPVLPGWSTHPEVLIKAPISTWAAKQEVEVTFADSEAVAALWGSPRRPSLHFLTLHSCFGDPLEHTWSVLLSSQTFSLLGSARDQARGREGVAWAADTWWPVWAGGGGGRESHPLQPSPSLP